MMNMNQMTNPFAFWQSMVEQGAKNFATVCGMPQQQKATLEPFAFSPLMQGNPFAVMQQTAQFWQNLWAPAKAAMPAAPAGAWPFFGAMDGSMNPKVTVMTVELGDMAPYIKQAQDFMGQWQSMWLQNVGGK